MIHHMVRNFFLAASVIFILHLCGIAQGTVLWNSVSAPNCIDQNLVITGLVQLSAGGTQIQAATTNVVVSVITSSQVRGNDTAPSQLYVNAASGLSVTFMLTSFDLSFVGSSDVPHTPLLIMMEGPGQINFVLQGGRTLSFTNAAGRGGTQVYLLMSNSNPAPTLFFSRNNSIAANQNAIIDIGPNSLLSYLSTTPVAAATDSGIIQFDPSNTDPFARLALSIENSGGVTIAGALTNQSNPFLITLANIDRTTAAGRNAIFQIVNGIGSSAEGGLLVTNKNAQLFDLLIDPFGNLGAALDNVNFKGSFSGNRLGFVLGANATLNINSFAYLDYVGLANNSCPNVNIPVKLRNGSALFIDGNLNPLSIDARINMAAESAIFFRSGIDNAGVIENDFSTTNTAPFTVISALQTADQGEIVFDVEAFVNINGSDSGQTLLSKIEILSLQVNPSGGPLFLTGTETDFPQRTFNTDCGALLAYNKAAFLVNNVLNLNNLALAHTDVNHAVNEKDDVFSEPTYVGGEAFQLSCFTPRPQIAFNNSYLLVQTDVAFSGVDLHVGNTLSSSNTCGPNLSNFVFFGNGQCVDNGTGRQFILGTSVGSKSCDGTTPISAEAHLDVISTGSCNNVTSGVLNELLLTVSLNNATINPCITPTCSCPLQTSLHTIFLGQTSNISIGLDALCCTSTTNAPFSELLIAGNYFAIDSRGGLVGQPRLGGVTGQGVIVVETNGIFAIGAQFIAAIEAMVVKTGNGQVILPEEQVFFGPHIGVTDFQLDLGTTDTIVPALANYAEYTLNWRSVTKDYDLFCPYDVTSVNMCSCPPVTRQNVSAIPTIVGEVNQFEIQGSRIGDPVHILVNGGWIRELIFQNTGCPGEAPTGIIVLQGDGRVGLNMAFRNTDSVGAEIVLGVNGVSIIANGNGQIDLNTDVIVNNHCSLLTGPDFVSSTTASVGSALRINADTVKEFRITKTGILDLRSFGVGDTLEFTGPVTVVLEAGAQILMAGGVVRFVDNASLICDPVASSADFFAAIPLGPIDNTLTATASTPAALPHNQFAPLTGFGAGVANTDSFRIKLIGTGTFDFAESSRFFIPKNTFVGVETLFELITDPAGPTTTCQIPVTNMNILVRDQALFEIGDNNTNGGTFQIGNTKDNIGHTISFTLTLNGPDAQFTIKPEGFVGFDVGIANKSLPDPNDWLVDTLFNVSNVTVNMIEGFFRHDRIFSGNDLDTSDPTKLPSSNASLLAFGVGFDPVPTYSFILPATNDDSVLEQQVDLNVLGGGNMVIVTSSAFAGQPGVISPIVTTQNGVVNVGGGFTNSRLFTGVLASWGMMPNAPASSSASGVFNFLAIQDFFSATGSSGSGAVAFGAAEFETARVPLRTAWVFSNTIGRADIFNLADSLGGTMLDRRNRAAAVGIAGLQIDFTQPAPGVLIYAQQVE